MSEWIGAVDGGGSKTASTLFSREGKLVVLPSVGGCNPQDNSAWDTELNGVMDRILAKGFELSAITMGMPGYGEIPQLDKVVSELVKSRFSEAAIVRNDVEMAYHGAFPCNDGILLLAGTGSMAIAGKGATLARIGGWGDQFGDEGSAYWIGRRALGLASQEIDGRLPITGFASRLCVNLGLDSTQDPLCLMNWCSRQRHARSAIAALARYVDELAQDQLVVAISILDEAAELLAAHITAARTKAGLPAATPWATAGSVFRSDRIVTSLTKRINSNPVKAGLPPIGGGLLIAAGQANWSVDEEFISNLAREFALLENQRKIS